MFRLTRFSIMILCFALAACSELRHAETVTVTSVIAGNMIDVMINGEIYRVRYKGINTPAPTEICYEEALEANRSLVEGQTVELVQDRFPIDKEGNLARYVYIGDVFVNYELVNRGYAEMLLYDLSQELYEDFGLAEFHAAHSGLGCHPTGIFDDGSNTE